MGRTRRRRDREADDAVVDPEAPIAPTAELGDADARLPDIGTDWCVAYGRYINGSRLKQVVRDLGTHADAVGEYDRTPSGDSASSARALPNPNRYGWSDIPATPRTTQLRRLGLADERILRIPRSHRLPLQS